ncbi:hypothetical protein GE061_008469 [Apolygus lucorum]|uniref:Elongation of very long chain fatty acids protein n=1 Tax=Apolygus lucorum TaxID=248454 RepID=A0A6A4IS60_APOLU|nr:hypothetical protein GE061_008469 [Apolygus lucorum]
MELPTDIPSFTSEKRTKMVLGIVRSAVDYHDHIMDKYGDPRVKSWLFMSGPLPTIVMCLTYVFFVKYLGPKLMEKREPFEFKKTMIVYNAIMVIMSAWMFNEALSFGWLAGYSLTCQPCDFSTSLSAMRIAKVVWWYYFSKFIEFLDTIFFVLRKKYSQVSTLHVIHHAIMPFSTWPGAKFYPGGHVTFCGTVNSFIHIFMYSYYLLAAFGPEVQKYLWWKKYLTTLQIVQFILVFLHSIQLLFNGCKEVPIAFAWAIIFHSILFYVLFQQFYKEAYVEGGKSKTKSLKDKMSFCMPTVPSNDVHKEQ